MPRKIRQKKFYKHIRELEKLKFGEFINEQIYGPQFTNNFYFAPSWHIGCGLLTEDLIKDIRDNGRQILSVGSGAAYLERFLVDTMDVKREQITLSDLIPIMPESFHRFVFDMYRTWPNFRKEFDYVIFPESVLLNCRFDNDSEKQKGLYHLIESSLAALKPLGQIRINGHCQIEENVEMVAALLATDHPDSRLTYSSQLIVVEKGYKS